MRVALLGPLQIEDDDGRPVEVAAPMRRALVAALAVEAGRTVSAERLIDRLWDEDPPPAALESLHAHISRLRREIGAKRVTTGPAGYTLRAGEDEVDIRTFERLLARARTYQRAGRSADAHDALTQALGLWRGDALDGIDGHAFVIAERVRLDALREAAREDRVEAMLALGRHERVLVELEAMVHDNPLRERPWGQLMLALYRSGRQADALDAYRRIRRMLVDELGLDPSPELQDLQRRILAQDPGLAAPTDRRQVTIRIPAPPTGLIGRRVELERAVATLRTQRLLTLTGPGGVGKTRLAIAVANALVGDPEDGILFVDLSAVREPSGVVLQISDALGGGGDRPDAVIGDRDLLLVLDNFEQVIDAAVDIARLLAACSRLRILVTSRAPLRIKGEHRLEIPPLPLDDAASLFTELAQAAFLGDTLPADLVDQVVERLDGLPLAVELAAAQIRVLSAHALRDRLTDRLATLAGGPRDAPDRHQTLRETIAWSYGLLGDDARAVFRRLSVLAGGFDLEAALAVGDTDVEGLAALVDQSLVRRVADRYAMLDSIHAFAAETAERDGDVAAARDRHLAYFVGVVAAEQASGDEGDHDAWIELVRAEKPNLKLAFEWAIERGDDPAAWALFHEMGMYLVITGAIDEGMAMCEQALPVARRLGLRQELSALAIAGEFPRFSGDLRGGLERKRQALVVARQIEAPVQLAAVLDDTACMLAELGEFDEAERLLTEAFAVRAEWPPEDPLEAAHTWATAAEVALRAGRLELAEQRLAGVVALETKGEPWPTWIVETEQLKAEIDLAAGRREAARERYELVVRDGVAVEFRAMVAHALDGLAAIAAADDPATAAGYLGMADRVRAEARSPIWDATARDTLIRSLDAALGHSELARLRAAGHAVAFSSIPERLKTAVPVSPRPV